MKLIAVIDAYIALQQSIGLHFETAKRTLHQFGRQMGDIQIDDVQESEVLAFLQGAGVLTGSWRNKYSLLSCFYRFAISRDYVKNSPLPLSQPKFPRQQTPYIYSTEELQRLLDATLTIAQSRQQAPTFRALILLLYGSGMRVGEAISLTIRDVDLEQGIITVRDTKFYKTRLVPIGPKLTSELAALAKLRRQRPMPKGEDSQFFTTRTGGAWTYRRVITLFQLVRRAACIGCPPGESRPPRLHDLRHTAAVHRLVSWYRSGQDVQRLLPQLATYLGHVDIGSTQRYLQMTPELLQEASRRFATYANCGESHEQ